MTEKEIPSNLTTSPEAARRRLQYMGFFENNWSEIMGSGFEGLKTGSHEVRALITIAIGKEPRVLGEVYREMRAQDNLPKKRK